MRGVILACGVAAVVIAAVAAHAPHAQPLAGAAPRPQPLQSGSAFAPASVRALEADEFANPGLLWVERGAKLWREAAGRDQRSCASCHGDAAQSMRGAATRYPQLDAGRARGADAASPQAAAAPQLINLEGRIRQCRSERQRGEPLDHESDALLALTAYVAHQSRGLPARHEIDPGLQPFFERGRAFYNTRVGQLNLACTHCHDSNWGRLLGPETISQGHGNAYPAYRLEWQGLGSLHRRFRSCLSGVRAGMFPYGAPQYLELELYLSWRGSGLPVESPGVRR